MRDQKAGEFRASAEPPRSSWPIRLTAGAGWVAVATLLQLLRQPGAPSWDTIFAEDGSFFLYQGINFPFGSVISRPVAGYLLLVPRLIAEPISELPLEWAAVSLAVGSSLIVALLSVQIYIASASIFSTRWGRMTLALATVGLPAAGGETVANLTNLQWFLMWGCFWLFLRRFESRSETVAGAIVAALTALTAPLSGFLLPIGAFTSITQRSWKSAMVFGSFVVGMAIQSLFVMTHRAPVERYHGETTLVDLPAIFGIRVAASSLFGEKVLYEIQTSFGRFGAHVFVVLFVAAVVAALKVGPDKGISGTSHRVFGISVAAFAPLLMALPLIIRGTEHMLPEAPQFNSGARYILVPAFMSFSLYLFLLERALASGRLLTRALGCAGIASIAAVFVANFSFETPRTAGPRWSVEVARGKEVCRNSPAGTVVRIPVSPPSPDNRWHVKVGCDRLLSGAR